MILQPGFCLLCSTSLTVEHERRVTRLELNRWLVPESHSPRRVWRGSLVGSCPCNWIGGVVSPRGAESRPRRKQELEAVELAVSRALSGPVNVDARAAEQFRFRAA